MAELLPLASFPCNLEIQWQKDDFQVNSSVDCWNTDTQNLTFWTKQYLMQTSRTASMWSQCGVSLPPIWNISSLNSKPRCFAPLELSSGGLCVGNKISLCHDGVIKKKKDYNKAINPGLHSWWETQFGFGFEMKETSIQTSACRSGCWWEGKREYWYRAEAAVPPPMPRGWLQLPVRAQRPHGVTRVPPPGSDRAEQRCSPVSAPEQGSAAGLESQPLFHGVFES